MHLRAFYVFAAVFLVAVNAESDDTPRWYTNLRMILKNCPLDSWNNFVQDEFLQNFRKCMQEHVLSTLDSLLVKDVITIVDGLDLVKFQEDRMNSMDNYTESDLGNNTNWTSTIVKRFLRILRTHVVKVDVDHFVNSVVSFVDSSETDADSNVFKGRRRRHRRRHNHMIPLLMMGFLLMGSILIPMGFQFLAVLGGKALLLAKMALILSSIQGLKKIATNGVNYGLYHSPVSDGWHDRSHLEPPPHLDLPFAAHVRP
ncbi:hypothetical protein ANTQUA_LOCUS9816 [Anthophora quadrimaculata]